MKNKAMLSSVPIDLLYQALETEKGGVQVYSTALRCVVNEELKEEWTKYLEQTKKHVQVLTDLLRSLELDPDTETPGRQIVRYLGTSLVKTMELALRSADPLSAQIVAAECVVHAETKDHQNWELIGALAKNAPEAESYLTAAYDEVAPEEDEHLYHNRGWTRELWFEALDMSAQLPPPEEKQDVKTEIEAAKANKSRTKKAGSK
ncbi:MAG TPA: ferritin-like domain-containing protein [Pyrinomonadaceae bacterium]